MALTEVHAFVDRFLEDDTCVNRWLTTASQKSNVERRTIVEVFTGLSALYLVFGTLAHLYSNLLCAGYPLIAGCSAMITDDLDQLVVWMLYLFLYVSTTIFEGSGEVLMDMFPIYFLVRTVIFMHLYLPQTFGIKLFLENWLKPFKKVKGGQVDKETLDSMHPVLKTMLGITPEMVESVNNNKALQAALRDINLEELLAGRDINLEDLLAGRKVQVPPGPFPPDSEGTPSSIVGGSSGAVPEVLSAAAGSTSGGQHGAGVNIESMPQPVPGGEGQTSGSGFK